MREFAGEMYYAVKFIMQCIIMLIDSGIGLFDRRCNYKIYKRRRSYKFGERSKELKYSMRKVEFNVKIYSRAVGKPFPQY